MSTISTAVCSITRTQRGRYFWAAWWTGAPCYVPFRNPDASNGGAASEDEALAEAERVAARHLSVIDPYWSRAWKAKLRGETPQRPRAADKARPKKPSASSAPASAWCVLGVGTGSSLDEIKRAYRKRALETHPDQGGDAERFREVQGAYERLLRKLGGRAQARRK